MCDLCFATKLLFCLFAAVSVFLAIKAEFLGDAALVQATEIPDSDLLLSSLYRLASASEELGFFHFFFFFLDPVHNRINSRLYSLHPLSNNYLFLG